MFNDEVIKRWGNTDAYKLYSKKRQSYSKEKWVEINGGLMSILAEFAECLKNGENVTSDTVQTLVLKLQNYITNNYYTCTNEILLGLGQMYAADERFKANIDKYCEGNAEYVSKAISYCLEVKNDD